MSRKQTQFNKATLKELRRSWKHSREFDRGRDGFYKYLEAVYDSYAELRKMQGEAKKTRNKIIKWKHLKRISKNTHPVSVIIVASSREDRRMQSRWAQALRYAWKWRNNRGQLTLTQFFKMNGGVAGCARKFSTKEKPAR